MAKPRWPIPQVAPSYPKRVQFAGDDPRDFIMVFNLVDELFWKARHAEIMKGKV